MLLGRVASGPRVAAARGVRLPYVMANHVGCQPEAPTAWLGLAWLGMGVSQPAASCCLATQQKNNLITTVAFGKDALLALNSTCMTLFHNQDITIAKISRIIIKRQLFLNKYQFYPAIYKYFFLKVLQRECNQFE